MSPAFLASLTLGALVAWLLCDLAAYKWRLWWLAEMDRVKRVPFEARMFDRIMGAINRPAA